MIAARTRFEKRTHADVCRYAVRVTGHQHKAGRVARDLAELGCGSTDTANSVTTEVKERCPPDSQPNATCARYLSFARPKRWLI